MTTTPALFLQDTRTLDPYSSYDFYQSQTTDFYERSGAGSDCRDQVSFSFFILTLVHVNLALPLSLSLSHTLFSHFPKDQLDDEECYTSHMTRHKHYTYRSVICSKLCRQNNKSLSQIQLPLPVFHESPLIVSMSKDAHIFRDYRTSGSAGVCAQECRILPWCQSFSFRCLFFLCSSLGTRQFPIALFKKTIFSECPLCRVTSATAFSRTRAPPL